MPNLTSVDITSGVPNSGTGTVSTIDALMADGGQATLGAKADAKSTATDTTAVSAISVWKQISASVQALVVGIALAASNARIGATFVPTINAAFGTVTRPANVTPYSANDAISNNGTAASVTAQTATASDLNDAPVFLSEMLLKTTDTGLAAAVGIRAYLFDSDPTASSGVGGGDNAAWSQKQAGFIGSMSGTFRAFSDGGKARLIPDEGAYIIANPVSGAQTFYVLYQILTGFTPSANSTTLDARLKGWQGRA